MMSRMVTFEEFQTSEKRRIKELDERAIKQAIAFAKALSDHQLLVLGEAIGTILKKWD